MNNPLYSVEDVAERLGLHVRTVRRYVREGRLPAVRIGKQYRIAHADLEAFTGGAVPQAPREAARQRRVEASSIVEIDAVGRETADRVTSLLMGAAASRRAGDASLTVHTLYDEERARMKVIVVGGLADTARLFDYLDGVLAS
ncbi:helix-turn-helix domain-containing protein [Nocardia terpenica]|uniref:DNA-binding protein n=1 Tax=Nocardia terpenica TaxID=455432 RepID=A0A291RGL1_9NOCA|nr:helix-turn-helix domain-containing protein [Nocardia terpenica]ATL66731.1 DNA-binding protein [Nocardia terpenica]